MGFFDFLLTGVGLSMDACAVSATHGLAMKRISWGRALAVALAARECGKLRRAGAAQTKPAPESEPLLEAE